MDKLQSQLSTTLQMVLDTLDSMQNSSDETDSALMTKMADMEVEWERRRVNILNMVQNIRTHEPIQEQTTPVEINADDLHTIKITEPRLAAGTYQCVIVNSEGQLKTSTQLVSVVSKQKILAFNRESDNGDVSLSFTIEAEDAPATLSLCFSTAHVARFAYTLYKLSRGTNKRFIFFNSDAVAQQELVQLSVGYMEDIAPTDCHEAILAEAVQRGLCNDVESARIANVERLFMRYHRCELPIGTYTHYLKSRPHKPAVAPSDKTEDRWKNPPGQSVFFLRHGATDLFAFGDVGDMVGVPMESVDYVRVPLESQRTSPQEDEVDYIVALDQLPQAKWDRIKDPSTSFSSRAELMDAVHNQTKYGAITMLELS